MNKDLTAVIPLESNPEVFDRFAYSLGLSTSYNFNDIFSIDDAELLAFLPRPVIAIVLLFPIQKNESLSLNYHSNNSISKDEQPIWLKQNFQNACGLYALLHILINNKRKLRKGSPLDEFLNNNKEIIGSNIDQFIINFIQKHNQDFNESSGETTNPDPETNIDLHFISFISYDGKLWELDGRSVKEEPLLLGNVDKTNQIDLENVDLINQPIIIKRIKKYMNNVDSELDKLKFSLMGLSKQ